MCCSVRWRTASRALRKAAQTPHKQSEHVIFLKEDCGGLGPASPKTVPVVAALTFCPTLCTSARSCAQGAPTHYLIVCPFNEAESTRHHWSPRTPQPCMGRCMGRCLGRCTVCAWNSISYWLVHLFFVASAHALHPGTQSAVLSAHGPELWLGWLGDSALTHTVPFLKKLSLRPAGVTFPASAA